MESRRPTSHVSKFASAFFMPEFGIRGPSCSQSPCGILLLLILFSVVFAAQSDPTYAPCHLRYISETPCGDASIYKRTVKQVNGLNGNGLRFTGASLPDHATEEVIISPTLSMCVCCPCAIDA